MNGCNRYLLDTNAVISLLAGNEGLATELASAQWIGISVITKLEFLAFSRLSEKDRCLFTSFLHRVNVMGLSETDDALHQSIIQKRRDLGLKLPDAIILATALAQDACLVTDDEGLLKIENPSVMPLPSRS